MVQATDIRDAVHERFERWQDVSTALETDNMDVLLSACKRLRFHLRLLFRDEHRDAALRVIVDYLENVPDLKHIWHAFNWSKRHPPLVAVTMDIMGLLLSVPIPLPTHRRPLLRILVSNHSDTIRSLLTHIRSPPPAIATLRTLTAAVTAGFAQDLADADLLGPYPTLAARIEPRGTSKDSQLQPKKKKQKREDEEDQKDATASGTTDGGEVGNTPSPETHHLHTIRSAYIGFMSHLLRCDSLIVRKRLLNPSREGSESGGSCFYLMPILKGLEEDSISTTSGFLDSLSMVAEDTRMPRAIKFSVFHPGVLSGLRRLYGVPTLRQDVHAVLQALCAVPGSGMCPGKDGSSPALGPPATMSSRAMGHHIRVMGGFAAKLEISDELQMELLLGILRACPSLVEQYLVQASLTLDPRPSTRWITTVSCVVQLLGLPVPDLQNEPTTTSGPLASEVDDGNSTSGVTVYSLIPPTVSQLLVHVTAPPLVTRAHLGRGLALSSPVVLFFTLRLVAAVLEKLERCVATLDEALAWWQERDEEAAEAWGELRAGVRAQAVKTLPDVASVLKCLFQTQELLAVDRYDLSSVTDPSHRELEAQEDVRPSMVYLMALRVTQLYASVLREYTPVIESSRLLNVLPPPEIVPDLLALLQAVPPALNPKSLATLLKLHASAEFGAPALELVESVLRSSSAFSGCHPWEVRWWLEQFPRSVPVIVFFTNLFGETTQNVYALLDKVPRSGSSDSDEASSEDERLQSTSTVSPMVVSLVYQLKSHADGKEVLPPDVLEYAERVLSRIRDFQTFPDTIDYLLRDAGVPTVPQTDRRDIHPFLAVTRFLQGLLEVAKRPAVLEGLEAFLDKTKTEEVEGKGTFNGTLVEHILNHPGLRDALRTHPRETVCFLVNVLVPRGLGESCVSEVMDILRRALVKAPTDTLCEAVAVLCTGTGRVFDLGSLSYESLSAAQWLALLPALAQPPAEAYACLFQKKAWSPKDPPPPPRVKLLPA